MADCAIWIAAVHNVTANESLNYRTPYEKRHGNTPDISAYILFHFWEKILYLDTDIAYPESKEIPGHFLGIAKNTGDALTFNILSQEGTRLTRSVIRSASGKPTAGFPNLRSTDRHADTHDTKETQPALLALKSADNGGG